MKKSLVTPCATIAKNAGVEPSLVVNKVIGGSEPSYGYDALQDEYVDMFKAGQCIFHPLNVMKTECFVVFGIVAK